MIESASNSLARSILAASWPQGLSPDAARAVDDAPVRAASQDLARAAQAPPSLSFSTALAAQALAVPGSQPMPEADPGAPARQSPGREQSRPGPGRTAYAAQAGRGGTAQAGQGLDLRV